MAGVTPVTDRASIGVIGGSGFYSLLDNGAEISVDTPFGPPSDPVVTGEVAGRRVAFLPRHGHDHRFPPHRIPYRANLWALRALGVRQVLAPSAVGSLTIDYEPGTLVIPDQLVDRTRTREQTYYDAGIGVGDQRERRVAEGKFPRQDRLGVPGHADQGPALRGEPL